MTTQSQLNVLQSELTELTDLTGKELAHLRSEVAKFEELKTLLVKQFDFNRCLGCGDVAYDMDFVRADDGECFHHCGGKHSCYRVAYEEAGEPEQEEDGMTLAKEIRERDSIK